MSRYLHAKLAQLSGIMESKHMFHHTIVDFKTFFFINTLYDLLGWKVLTKFKKKSGSEAALNNKKIDLVTPWSVTPWLKGLRLHQLKYCQNGIVILEISQNKHK